MKMTTNGIAWGSAFAVLLLSSACAQLEEAWENAMRKDVTNATVKSLHIDDGGFSKASSKPEEKEYEYVLQFHGIPADPNKPDMTVMPVLQSGNLPPMIVEKNLYCHSRDIEEIELVPSPNRKGYYQLVLKLSDRGRKRWFAMSGDMTGKPIAILLDGEYQRYFYVDRTYDGRSNYVVISANFSERLANKIKKAAPKNYRHFNRSPFEIF